MNICICITESLCYTPESNTTLKGNYTPIKQQQQKKLARTHTNLRVHMKYFLKTVTT